jgi:hypothetical protein
VNRPIKLIFDASAILSYSRSSIHAGEPLGEVADEDALAGLPLLALVEARRHVTDPDLLDLLVGHDATTIVTPTAYDWQALAALCDLVGRVDTASAVLASYSSGAQILTAQPGLYAGLAGGGPIIEIPRS